MHVEFQGASEKRSLRGCDRARKHSPIDWPAIEVDFRAGTLSLRGMALKHGCSHSTIANHAGRHRWTRTVERRPFADRTSRLPSAVEKPDVSLSNDCLTESHPATSVRDIVGLYGEAMQYESGLE
jgi:hypothetical protein